MNVNATVKSPPPQDAAHGQYDTSDVNWHATTPDEMKAFVGINMQMGIKVLPEYKDYWSSDPALNVHLKNNVKEAI